MRTERTILRTALLKNSLRKSLHLAAAAACLGPAIAQAQTWNPTASDVKNNTAAGYFALAGHNGDGGGNVGIGYAALTSNTTGNYNTASGYVALSSNTTGNYNTASGAHALYFNTTGSFNTANGISTLLFNTTGGGNTASGYSALDSNTTGSNNVATGYNALFALKSGNSNVALGANAGKNLKTGSSNIYIGHNGTAGGIESKVLRIGQVQTKTFIAGVKGVPVSGATVVVRANGQLGVVASSARYKTDIRDLTDASDRLGQLHPVSYQYKTEPGVTHYGLIAEEVDRVMPELVVRDEANRPETVQYHEIIPLLLKERQLQRAELARQRELIEQQTRTASRDHATIERLEARLARQAAELSELRRTRFAATAAAK